MEKILAFLFCIFSVVSTMRAEEYTPFVEEGKHWHVLGFCFGPYFQEDDFCFGRKRETIGEHAYLPLYKGDPYEVIYAYDGEITAPSLGLFREEGKRVYLYDRETEREYCVYDFTLEEGDIFDIGIGERTDRRVVTKTDYITVKGKRLRTLTLTSTDPENGGSTQWVEGIGSLGMPTDSWNPYADAPSSWYYTLAYMVFSMASSWPLDYYPFDLYGTWGSNNFVIGQDLTRGEELPYTSSYGGPDSLKCEITDGKLHVTGSMWLQCGPNNYVCCHVSPKDSKNQISFVKKGVEPVVDRMARYAIDLYFEHPFLFSDESIRLVYVDSDGVEHPVTRQDAYHPFIEEGKVWTVGRYPMGDSHLTPYGFSQYYFDGDTIIGGRICERWMKDGELIAPLYEEGRRVYYFSKEESVPKLLYDFSVEMGDKTIVNQFNNGDTVSCYIDSVKYNKDGIRIFFLYDRIGIEYAEQMKAFIEDYNENKEMYDQYLRSEFTYTWMEGIGYLHGPKLNVGQGGIPGNIERLIQVRVGDRIIYEIPDANWGENGIATTERTEKSGHSQAVYDLSGRRISAASALPKGVYVRNGRKVVMLE